MYDVVIVGAGPAGTTAGYLLGRSGLSVLVLDRKNFPRKKACAGGITPKAMALYPFDISKFIRRICREVKIVRPGGASFIVNAKTPLCYISKRTDLDAYSLGKAVQAGCCFKKIDKIICLDQDNSGVSLTLSREGKTDIVRANYLIGADGANSKIRRLIGSQQSRIVKLPALEADVPVKNAECYPMTFDFSREISGYYWIFPRKNHVNIGIFSARPNGIMNRALLKKYAGEQLGTDVLTDVKGYPIATSSGRVYLGEGRVLLVGDAAGLAEPLLGEGIYSALKSGILSARAIEYDAAPHLPAHSGALCRYRRSLNGMTLDLRLYRFCASILYKFPKWSLAVGSRNVLHNRFSRGYAGGKTLHEILIPF